ncbi:U3 snoRNA associated-domain-containing protein [Alternaria rosae]|uniref:U3 snoRNA associated-domain-containing protein n=1 Tax=Alternaria rosae TaxID=1187941 RepID=UPI001E8E5590|nr:U3 snoRNA associated-domain-containing protein [Alternaria rosae]KAH6877892.1 U3 snoRNA associated-domain-containing protein [Alternaria rosae]
MVTTRGGTETPGAPTPTPRSSTRKAAGKRELESLETPTQTKRQRKSAPTSSSKKRSAKQAIDADAPSQGLSQESVDDVSDTIAIAAPATQDPQTPTKDDFLPLRRRSSPHVVVSRKSPDDSTATDSFGEGREDAPVTSQNPSFYTPAQQPGSGSGSVYATPATTFKQPEGSPTPKAKKGDSQTPASGSAKRGRGRPKKAVETPSKFPDEIPTSSYESSTAPIPSQDDVPPSAQPEKTHRRFGSEEPAESQDSPAANKQGNKRYEASQPIESLPPTQTTQVNQDEASDSDNEAPEVVTTAAASSKARATQAEADRAQKAQQAKEQAKRQAREELVAAQQAAKREREEKKAKKLAKKAAKEAKAAAGPLDEEPEVASRMDIDVSNGLLPASLLETIDDQRPPTPPPERRGKTEEELKKEKLNHHIKFLERVDKPAKDVKKGKLSVAVLAQQNRVLPPKVNRNTKNVREHWLKGREMDKKGGKPGVRFGKKMERRPHGNRGFLRNGE